MGRFSLSDEHKICFYLIQLARSGLGDECNSNLVSTYRLQLGRFGLGDECNSNLVSTYRLQLVTVDLV